MSLTFYYGLMSSGKSTFAIQYAHNLKPEKPIIFSRLDRKGEGVISSRIGVQRKARNFDKDTNFFDSLLDFKHNIVVDEAQFLTEDQVDQLHKLSYEYNKTVICYGLLTDYRTKMFEGSKRLFEVADNNISINTHVPVYCECGRPAKFNAYIKDGKRISEGDDLIISADMDDFNGFKIVCDIHYFEVT